MTLLECSGCGVYLGGPGRSRVFCGECLGLLLEYSKSALSGIFSTGRLLIHEDEVAEDAFAIAEAMLKMYRLREQGGTSK